MWSWCYSTAEKQAASMIGDANLGIPVGLLKPNNWGLYDMHGNVGEWCLDWVDKNAFSTVSTVDPSGCANGGELGCRAIRGGATAQWSFQCRSGTRMGLAPTYSSWATGLRVVCPAKAVK